MNSPLADNEHELRALVHQLTNVLGLTSPEHTQSMTDAEVVDTQLNVSMDTRVPPKVRGITFQSNLAPVPDEATAAHELEGKDATISVAMSPRISTSVSQSTPRISASVSHQTISLCAPPEDDEVDTGINELRNPLQVDHGDIDKERQHRLLKRRTLLDCPLFMYYWPRFIFHGKITIFMKLDGKNFGLMEREIPVMLKSYAKEFLLTDFVVAFPIAAIILICVEDDASAWNLLSLIDVCKFLRIKRSFARFQKGTLTNPALFKLMVLFLVLLYSWHLLACIYWFIEAKIESEVQTAMQPPEDFLDEPFFAQYLWAWFWSVSVTVAGIGEYPETPKETALASFGVMSGIFITTAVISTANNALREYDTLAQSRTRRLREVLQYLKGRKASSKLIRQVLEYYQYCFENNVGVESGDELLTEMPKILRDKLVHNFYQPIISKIPLFHDLPPVILDDLILTLQRRIYVPGEYLIVKGEIGQEMYVIRKGRIRVELDSQRSVYLGAGDYLGEQACLTFAKRNADVFCESHCELLVLQRSDFMRLSKVYPQLPMHILHRSMQYRNSTEKARISLIRKVRKSLGINLL